MTDSLYPRGLFITGTDTGVGKTLVGGGLAAVLREQGFDPAVMKPAESGFGDDSETGAGSDAEFLREMASVAEPLECIAPYRFREPVAPGLAAELERVEIDLEKLTRLFREIAGRHEFTLVEGAGGLMVPLTREGLVLDLIQHLGLPVLVVGRGNLGTINHTLMTVRCLETARVKVAGIVLNHLSPDLGMAEKTNPEMIARHTEVPIWGILPYEPAFRSRRADKEKIIRLIREHINLDPLYRLMRAE